MPLWIGEALANERVRRYIAFVISGATAFAVNAIVLEMLIRLFGLAAAIAAPLAIACAMVVSWLMQRTFTFKVEAPPTLVEFAKFVGVSWMAAAVNYVTFLAVLQIQPQTPPIVALAIAAIVALFVAFAGMRRAVFVKK